MYGYTPRKIIATAIYACDDGELMIGMGWNGVEWGGVDRERCANEEADDPGKKLPQK